MELLIADGGYSTTIFISGADQENCRYFDTLKVSILSARSAAVNPEFRNHHLLVSFLAVADTGHFREAAARLHISQPPLTRRIQALEQELGVSLFTRTTRRVALTPAGEQLARRLRPCFDEIEAACQEARMSRQTTAPMVIGMTPALDDSVLPSRSWLEAQLGRSVEIERRSSRELLTRLAKQDYDAAITLQLALIGLPSQLPAQVESVEVGRDPLWVILPEAGLDGKGCYQASAQASPVELCELGDTPLFWFPRRDNPEYFDHCERLFQRAGYRPPRREEPQDHHRLLARVAASEGIALVPQSFLATRRDGVIARPLSARWAELTTRIAIAWRRDNDDARNIALRLAEALQEHTPVQQ